MSRARISALTKVRAARIPKNGCVLPISMSTAGGRKRRTATFGWSRCRRNGQKRPGTSKPGGRRSVVSIGHTKAKAEQIQDAVRAGATMSTHIGNGAHESMLQRHPNYIWDQLAEDRLAAGLIVDGIHLGAAFVKAAVRAKGSRVLLVTDASMPACATPGIYRLGEQEVELTEDDRVVLAGTTNRLAGSSLRMDHAIANVMRMTGISLVEASRWRLVTPRVWAESRAGSGALNRGDRADLVQFRWDGQKITVLQNHTRR